MALYIFVLFLFVGIVSGWIIMSEMKKHGYKAVPIFLASFSMYIDFYKIFKNNSSYKVYWLYLYVFSIIIACFSFIFV